MAVFECSDFDAHEAMHAFCDEQAGYFGFIAIHSTHRGPAAGGCRLWHYDNSEAAMIDALRLSRGMSYKNAMAGLDLGGGKAVIMRPEDGFDRSGLFTAFGQAVDAVGGRYITAEDVGVSPDDMKIVRTQTAHVGGLNDGAAASGDPSPITADGVFRCMGHASETYLGQSLKGVRVAVQGLGHVGFDLCRRLSDAGATLTVTDINTDLCTRAASEFGAVVCVPEAIYDADVDIYAPCALGATINPKTIKQIKARIIAGAANNQLETPELGRQLRERGIVYCPDFIVNAGGIINIASEISGTYEKDWVKQKLTELVATLSEVLNLADRQNRPSNEVANEIARARIGRG